MSRPVITCRPTDPVSQVANIMIRRNISARHPDGPGENPQYRYSLGSPHH
ncbi:CBS domain-containing protein [Desulforamulus ruminis]